MLNEQSYFVVNFGGFDASEFFQWKEVSLTVIYLDISHAWKVLDVIKYNMGLHN